jgi:G2/mitotic-specific cyclin 3/4
MSFLRRISKGDDYDLETRTMAKYLIEVTIMDERFVASPPSYVAAGAHCLARLLLEKGDWTPAHIHYSGYTFSQLKPLVGMIFDCCQIARKHHAAVFEKYSHKRYKRLAATVEYKICDGFTLSFQQKAHHSARHEPYTEEHSYTSFSANGSLKMPIPIEG